MSIAAKSTNTKGFVHFGGDIVSGIEDGTGIIVGSASTAATPYLEPIADESNANIGIRAKGTGTITIGNSSNVIALGGGRFIVPYTPPALAASTAAESTYAVTGLSTAGALFFTPMGGLSPAYTIRARCSTANELVLAWGNLFGSTIGTGESTGRGILVQFT